MRQLPFPFIYLFGLLLWPLAIPAFAQTAAEEGARITEVNQMDLLNDDRKLTVGDRLMYSVLEEREDPMAVFVNDRGEIEVPLAGKIQTSGKTCRQLATEIKQVLEKDYFHRATVVLKYQFANNTRGRVNVAGAVARQGPISIPSDEVLTVSGAILRSGGMVQYADATKVALIRKSAEPDGKETRTEIDVAKIYQEGRFDLDIAVQPDDLIVVPQGEQTGGQVYVLGAVNNPGLMNFSGNANLTVSKAILQAGGFNRFAKTKEVKLIRSDPSIPASERTIIVNVDDILVRGDRSQDPVVKPNDIIRVEEKLISL
ncbi:MAG: SLBB domain-containing protein [Verrucomicrobiota bacterium]|nr:SLBB domain-containing protein [Verrucomicrobiota bacterium]